MSWLGTPLRINWRRVEQIGDKADYWLGWAIVALTIVVVIAQGVMAIAR